VKGYDNFTTASDIILGEEVIGMAMYHSAEQEKRIHLEQKIMRPGKAAEVSLCQYKNVSCVRCCLPHIGGDAHMEGSEESRYLGPDNLVMKFKNFNPLQDPKIEASQYEDSFPDVGKAEMERRFSQRRDLFLALYDPEQPRQSLPQYMKAAQGNEGYKYKHAASEGPVSLFLGGSVPKHFQKGELPECQLLGFVDGKGTIGRNIARLRRAGPSGILPSYRLLP
jgi:hypothetical protein